MIQVESMDVEISSNSEPIYGWAGDVRGFSRGDPSARVRVTIRADGEDLERFLDFMRGVKAQAEMSRPALPSATKALPQGVVDAEFVEDE